VSYVDTNGMHGQVVSTVSKNSRNQNPEFRIPVPEGENSSTHSLSNERETQKLRNSLCSHCVQKFKFQIQRELQNCQNCQNCSIAIKKKRMMNNAQRLQSQPLKNPTESRNPKSINSFNAQNPKIPKNSQKFPKSQIAKMLNSKSIPKQHKSNKAQFSNSVSIPEFRIQC